jgi:hypothetical protein
VIDKKLCPILHSFAQVVETYIINLTVHQSIPGVPKIKDNYNPATWMMEATSAAVEDELKIDFANIYKESPLNR